MERTYRIVCAKDAGAVTDLAEGKGWTVLQPIREFKGIDSDHDGIISDLGRIVTHMTGFFAVCYKEIEG